MRVIRYFEYLFGEKKLYSEEGAQLIDRIAPALREDVMREIYTGIFKKQKLFYLNFSEAFIS